MTEDNKIPDVREPNFENVEQGDFVASFVYKLINKGDRYTNQYEVEIPSLKIKLFKIITVDGSGIGYGGFSEYVGENWKPKRETSFSDAIVIKKNGKVLIGKNVYVWIEITTLKKGQIKLAHGQIDNCGPFW